MKNLLFISSFLKSYLMKATAGCGIASEWIWCCWGRRQPIKVKIHAFMRCSEAGGNSVAKNLEERLYKTWRGWWHVQASGRVEGQEKPSKVAEYRVKPEMLMTSTRTDDAVEDWLKRETRSCETEDRLHSFRCRYWICMSLLEEEGECRVTLCTRGI